MPLHLLASDGGRIHVALRVNPAALGPAVREVPRLDVHRVVRNDPRQRTADTEALLPARVVEAVRLGVEHVNLVVVGDVDAARPAELPPLVDVFAIAGPDQDAVVTPIGDKQATSNVDRHRVRLVELQRTVAANGAVPEKSDEFSLCRVFGEERLVTHLVMRVGDVDEAVRISNNIGRLIELIRHAVWVLDVFRADDHQELSLRAKLADEASALVGGPHVVVAVDV